MGRDLSGETVCAADQESKVLNATIAPHLKPVREFPAGELITRFVKRNHSSRLWQGPGKRLSFIPQSLDCRRPTAIADFSQLDRPSQPFQIVVEQGFRGARFEAAYGGDRYVHRAIGRVSLRGPSDGNLLGREIDRPHFLEAVEFAYFGPEQMDDDIAGIDQHPIAGLLPLDCGHSPEHLFEIGTQSFG